MSAITAHCGCFMHLAYSRPLWLAGQKCLFLASMKGCFGSADSPIALRDRMLAKRETEGI